MEVITRSNKKTQRLGERIGGKLRGGEILALVGDLGSGKTTFVQGLAKGLGIKGRVVSPTFIIMRQYTIPISNIKHLASSFYHVDLYRLETNLENEIASLGLTDVCGKKDGVVAIEWAEKIRELIPASAIWINFELLGENWRKITLPNES